MRILGIIPARKGSKGVRNKNIRNLGDIPLIEWTIRAARQSSLDKVIVSTDGHEIAKHSKCLGIDVPFIRPDYLSGDAASSIDVINHAVEHFESKGQFYDAVMMLQPTTPFRLTEDIQLAIELFTNNYKHIDSVISVVDVEGHHPARMKYMDSDQKLIDPPFCEEFENQPRQNLRPMYIRNGAIYLTKVATLKENSFKGENSVALVMPQFRSVNIDTEFDFAMAEWILREFIADDRKSITS